MSITFISLVCFIAITGVAGTLLLVIRDLRVSSASPSGGTVVARPVRTRLRRQLTVFDEQPATSLSGRIDQSFYRLVMESGWDVNPVTAFLFLIGCGILVGGIILNTIDNPISAVAGFVIGTFAGILTLIIRRNRRMVSIQEELPNVMDLMSRAVRAGRSLDQAIDLLGNECEGHLGLEFKRCSGQLKMGRSMAAVMNSLAHRVRLVDLKLIALTLIVHRKTGGNLAQTLERMANVIRDRMTARRQMRAATGAGRASTILIATVSPVAYLLMFAIAPEHMEVLYTDPMGRMMLGTAIVLEIVGILWVMALLRRGQ
ncbi:MAG: type II secretion system F family protein [Planctomycetota bacterium]|nr:type II secretion system F family protein [Planctomycetota bacterium]MDA1163202.1 type II secretion system F family protein [Planctomycetota bacterium]